MKHLYLILLICLYVCPILAQETEKIQINYDISVELFPDSKTLKGDIDIAVKNKGTFSIDTIFLLLYPNAYSSPNTEFGKQLLRQGREDFYFANADDRGYIKNLHFTLKGRKLTHHFYRGKADIAYLLLRDPLQPGDSIVISSPFEVKIPTLFSRMGHVGETFQISQWFPKLAPLTDSRQGLYSYLDMGEFYYNYADYAVHITLPSHYIVAATGILHTEKEKEWYRHLSEDYNAQCPYSSPTKTLFFTAHQVVDFAWFTSPDFSLKYSTINIDGKQVTCRVFYDSEDDSVWADALKYTERALKDFSAWVGPYLYPQMSIVGASLKAGSGMEYPMVCLIGKVNSSYTLDEVIAHEIAHNWFYGMIATDERKYPFLDEGLTTALEMRYMKKYYPQKSIQNRPIEIYPYTYEDYYYWARLKQNFPLSTLRKNRETSDFSYYMLNYQMVPGALEFLRYYAGTSQWDAMFHNLYKEEHFQHLKPEELKSHFKNSFQFKTDWLFEDYFTGEKTYDYTFVEVNTAGDSISCVIKNGSGLMAPLILQQYVRDSVVWEKKISAFANEKSLTVPYIAGADSLSIYTGSMFIGYSDKRSYDLKKKELVEKELTIGFLFGYEPPERSSVFLAPIVGFNAYDGIMAGIGFYNISLPAHALEFQLLPLYGFRSHELAGILDMSYDFYSKRPNLNRLRISLNMQRFHSSHNEVHDFRNSYVKISPSIGYRLKQNAVSYGTTTLKVGLDYIWQHIGIRYDYPPGQHGWATRDYTVYHASIKHENTHPIRPYEFKLSFQNLGQSWRTSLELASSYKFLPRARVGMRVFTGLAQSGGGENGPLLLFYTSGATSRTSLDYSYDNFLLGRTEQNGMLAQQVYERDVSFPLPVIYPLGERVIGGNIYVRYDLGFIGIEPYFYLSSGNKSLNTGNYLYTSGCRISLADDIIHINFPFSSSDALREAMNLQGHEQYYERITFSVDFRQMLPKNLFQRIFSVE